ncbi:unnamed protein product [Lepeophtheirus salmonis]|uniref:(salmon louse) hypothetical protein n=1 Tax=Lepeophtheirus salmonis TaxID=72036 RepID=A0A7R8D276_LEPSM|nr:unnamed protein product [Lepeophtheirus salmonis]CAF2974547.1 unnamed protein product [Lepeophtheirus salmonis]
MFPNSPKHKKHCRNQLDVIGAGLPRTGTMSLKEALNILYPEGPCYHMLVFSHGRKFQGHRALEYNKAISGKTTKEDWYTFFDKTYPEAKVVLTVRDVQSWHDSCHSTIFNNHENHTTPWIYYLTGLAQRYHVATRIHNQIVPGFSMSLKSANKCGPEASKAYFDKWIEEVKNNIPEEQLLIFDVRQGWEPLCKFLDRPIPNVPFPRANDRASMKKRISNF